MITRLVAPLALAAGCCAASSAAQETLVRALLADGSWMKAKVVSVSPGEWRVAQEGDGQERTIPDTEVLAFIMERSRSSGRDTAVAGDQQAAQEAPSPISFGLLEFANGQKLPGTFRAARDANYWDHRWIGSIPIDLAQLATLRFRGARTPDRRTDGDSILLLNGDLLTGFVEKLGADIEFEPLAADDGADTKPARRTIANDRVAAISLARTEVAPSGSPRIWSFDGSVVDGASLRFDAKLGWGFELADPLMAKIRSSRTSDNSAANPIAALLSPSRVVPLADAGKPTATVPPEHYQFGIDRAVRVAPVDRALLGLASIELAGPVIASFPVPAAVGAALEPAIFTCEVALAEPAPRDARVDIEFRSAGGAPVRVTLDGQNRRRPVSFTSGKGSLEIAVTDGGNGIAGDAIVLERACFILSPRK